MMNRVRPNKTRRTSPRPMNGRRELEELKMVHMHRGQVAKYHDGIPDMLYRMSRLGFTVAQSAKQLGVAESTLAGWLQNRREAREAYEEGKWEHSVVFEEAMFRKVHGYEYEETKEFSGVDTAGREWTRTVTTVKRVEPDTTAQIFYAKNRFPERWHDVREGSTVQVNVQNNTMHLDRLSEEDREFVGRVSLARIIESDDAHELTEES